MGIVRGPSSALSGSPSLRTLLAAFRTVDDATVRLGHHRPGHHPSALEMMDRATIQRWRRLFNSACQPMRTPS